ncbi:MAG TPA: VCBS repeat-containing protein [Phycisphaerae bacterium]|nr:VCBS repeat-containing protein [Phycisphaerae bacterium]HRW55832.1 VCBS repeat-containing protein [Phycisphaerae bacterium]
MLRSCSILAAIILISVTTPLQQSHADECLPYSYFPPVFRLTSPTSIGTAADFNGDGIRDVLIHPGPVALIGGADGGLTPHDLIDGGLPLDGVFMKDVNADGIADIFGFWRNYQHDTFCCSYISEPDGTLSLQYVSLMGHYGDADEYYVGAYVGYLNLTTFPIVLSVTRIGDITQLDPYTIYYDGALSHGPPQTIPIRATKFLVANLNGDERNDLLVQDDMGAIVSFIGPLIGITEDTIVNPGDPGSLLAASDMDDDGISEVIVKSGALLRVYKRSGAAYDLWLEHELPDSHYRYLGAGDYDNDGDVDFMVDIDACTDGGKTCCISLFENINNEYLVAGPTLPSACEPNSAEVVDLDDNGLNDIIVAATYGVTLHYADGSGGFLNSSSVQQISSGSATYVPIADAADLNGDGLDDVIYRLSNGRIWVRINLGNGAFASPIQAPLGSSPQDLRCADMNEDGILDIVYASHTGHVLIGLGVGDGHFGQFAPFSVGGEARDVAVGDLNGDGHLDAVAACWNTDTVTTMFGDGHGGLHTRRDYAAPDAPIGVAIADFNGDGFDDVVTANGFDHTIATYLSNAAGELGAFTERAASTSTASPQNVQVADLDLDGVVDMIVPRNGARMWFGDGAGGFSAPLDISVGGTTHRVEVADLDHDTLPDLIWTDPDRGVTVARNLGNREFVVAQHMAAGGPAYDATAGDFDGLGDLDIILAHRNGTSIYFADNCELASMVPGDANGDGALTQDDIPDFVNILINNYGSLAARKATDMNADGRNDGRDLQLFSECLVNGGC